MNDKTTREMMQEWLFSKLLFHDRYAIKMFEYYKLSSQPYLSDLEADRLEELLVEAESDQILHFWLTEVDRLVGRRLGLLDESHLKRYENQQAWLREYLVPQIQEDLAHNRELQELLRRKECYEGPLDGVFGAELLRAIEKFQAKEHLKVDGVVGLKTLVKLADTPEEAKRLLTSHNNRLFDAPFDGGGDA